MRGEFHLSLIRAVNEALLPILADHIAAMRSREADNKLWQAAFKEADTGQVLSLSEAANLNRLLHIAPSTNANAGTERGTVIDLPQKFHGNAFEPTFELAQGTAANKQFWCKEFKKNEEAFHWGTDSNSGGLRLRADAAGTITFPPHSPYRTQKLFA